MKVMKWVPLLSTYQMVAVTFLGLILTGTLLLMLPLASATGGSLSFLNSLFTATSAACVTGLIVVDTGTYFSLFGQLVIITLIQLGGLGIMTFATIFSVAFGKKINLQERLRIQESLNQSDISGVVRLCLNVVKYTLWIEFAFGTVLAINFFPTMGLQGIYWGYWHAVSAFCNAGFDLMGGFRSMTGFVSDWTVNVCLMSLITLGGLGFAVMEDILRVRKFSLLRVHTKLVLIASMSLILVGAVLLWLLEHNNPATMGSLSLGDQIMASLFQSVSPRTAGFNTLALEQMTDASLFLCVVLMFVGASPASTGGGIKTTSFALALMTAWALIRGKADLALFGRKVKQDAISKSFIITTIAVMWVVSATFCLSVLEGDRFLYMLFEVVSAFATVGLTAGVTQSLCPASKVILILTMFAGRVGVLTFVMALMHKRKPKAMRYPEENIMIG
ncbi:MAG: TrkH family potassium uptake protein [Acidaminococcaceae bacterium]